MNRSIIRRAALACTFATLALTSAGAWAQASASVTLNDPNCLSFTLTGTPPNQVLNCVQSTTPLCTISGPSTGTINSPIALNSTCVPAATSYLWAGGNCAGQTTKGCTDPGSGTGYTNGAVINYTVTGTNGVGAGTSSAFAVTWSNTPPQAPSGCSVTGLPSGNQTSPYSYALSVTCSGGGAATSWAWSGGSTATTQAISGSITATTTFNVVATNGGGSAPAASGTITIGGGNGTISCPGFNNTHVVVIPWGPPGSSNQVATSGAWGANDAYIIQFTTPGGTSGNIGSISATEFQSGPFSMATKLSATACDFTNPGVSQSPTTYFEVTNTVGQNLLQPNTTYYWNMKHYQSGGGQAIIILSQPNGL